MSQVISPSSESPRGFLLAAYNSIVHNAKDHRKTRVLLVSYLLTLVIIPPIVIMAAFFVFPLHTAHFFNFPLKSNSQIVLGESTTSRQGNVLGRYVSAILEPQAVATVQVLRVVKPEVGSTIVLPAEGSRISEVSERESGTQSIDNYTIANVDNGEIEYYGYSNKDGGWYIMKFNTDNTNGSFRYIRGDSDFSANWARRDKLEYDYFSKVFN